jgi:hypothetical protein
VPQAGKKEDFKMKRMALIISVLFLAVGLVYAKDYAITKKAGEYTVLVTIDRNPPITGKNQLTVGIKDGAGTDITDASVAVDYGMPAMPGMPAMNYKADAALKGNEYKAKVNFSMAGGWNFNIQITQAGKIKKVKFNVDVK